MTGLAAQAALVWALGTTGWEVGYATRYNPGRMHAVAAYRDLPVADCMVSYDRAPLGAFVWVRSENTGRLLFCQITDVSKGAATVSGSDKWRHVRANLIEADWASARELCGDAFDGPWRECKVQILKGVSPNE